MPAYDISLWDFLKYTSHVKKQTNGTDLFPLKERLEMSRRICDGLLQMNTQYNTAHRDIKLRLVLKSTITIFLLYCLDLKFFSSNILLNVNTEKKWKSGAENSKSVVITDFGISTSIRVSDHKKSAGTAGWAPPEQWIGKFHIP